MSLHELHIEVPRKSMNERRIERCRMIIGKKMQELCDIHPPDKGMPRRDNSSAKNLRGKISKAVKEIRRARRLSERSEARLTTVAPEAATPSATESSRVMFYDPYYDRAAD